MQVYIDCFNWNRPAWNVQGCRSVVLTNNFRRTENSKLGTVLNHSPWKSGSAGGHNAVRKLIAFANLMQIVRLKSSTWRTNESASTFRQLFRYLIIVHKRKNWKFDRAALDWAKLRFGGKVGTFFEIWVLKAHLSLGYEFRKKISYMNENCTGCTLAICISIEVLNNVL